MILMKPHKTRLGYRHAAGGLAILLTGLAVLLGGGQVDARRLLPTEESSQRKTAKVPIPGTIDATEGLTIHGRWDNPDYKGQSGAGCADYGHLPVLD